MSDEAPPPAAAPPAAPPAADPPRVGDEQPRTVPYERLQEATAARRVWETRAAELETKLKGYEAIDQQVAKLRSEIETERAARQAEAAAWAEERALLGVGFVDQEAQDAARFAWSKLPEDKRPKDGIGAWLGELRADPTKAPKVLTPFLPQPQTQPPSPRPGVGASPIPAANVSVDALRLAREDAQRTGDWSKWEKLARGA